MEDTDKIIRDILWDDEDDFLETPDTFKEQIELFRKDLKTQKLSEKTIRKHVENVDFYLHEFGVNHGHVQELKDGCYTIGFYFGGWYIYKCAWASKTDCKSQASSIKKFYKCMLEHGLIQKEDYQNLANSIKENQEVWIDTIERYDEWLMGDGDDDFDWYDDKYI